MKGMQTGNDAALLCAKVVVSPFTRQFESRFIRFATRITEKYLLGKSGFSQGFRQFQNRLVGKVITDMPQLLCLIGQCFNQLGRRMSQTGNSDTARQIKVMFAILIPEIKARSSNRNECIWCKYRHHHFIKSLAIHYLFIIVDRSICRGIHSMTPL